MHGLSDVANAHITENEDSRRLEQFGVIGGCSALNSACTWRPSLTSTDPLTLLALR